jgi:hypothetical protein
VETAGPSHPIGWGGVLVFDEVRFDLRLTPDGSLSVHATSQVLPEEWADTVPAEQLEQLRLLRERLAKHQITEAELVRMGLLLGDALVPDSIQEPLAKRVAGGSDRSVRMRVVVHDPELSALPWEYVRLPSRYDELGGSPLALDERVSLVRSPAKGAAATNPTLRGRDELRVLHASATSVEGFDPLRGDDHAVDLALWGESGSRRTRRVVVDRLSDPATRESLDDALSSCPDLFVFTGHSISEDGRASLVLADEEGRPDLIGGAELAAMLLRAGTPLVVLNACDTATSDDTDASLAEQLVRAGVGTAIGMQMPISDSNAGHFAVGLVSALGEGLPVDTAVTQGRRRVADRAGYAEWGIPTLVSSSRVSEPRPAVGEARTRGGELVGAAPAAGDGGVTRGGRAAAPPRTRSGTDADRTAPRRARGPLVGALTLVVLALIGGGAWLLAGDDEDEPIDAQVAGITETSQQPPPPDREFPDDGFYDAKLFPNPSVQDSSPALRVPVDQVGRSVDYFGTLTPLSPATPQSMLLPGLPATANFIATNATRNSDCWKVILNDVTVRGVAGDVFFGEKGLVVVRAMQLADEPSAQRFYWATSLYAGLQKGDCGRWPDEDSGGNIATDPDDLEVSRTDFHLRPTGEAVRPEEILTAKGRDVEVEGRSVTLATAHTVVFRYDDVVALILIGSFDGEVSDEDAKATLAEGLRLFSEV